MESKLANFAKEDIWVKQSVLDKIDYGEMEKSDINECNATAFAKSITELCGNVIVAYYEYQLSCHPSIPPQ